MNTLPKILPFLTILALTPAPLYAETPPDAPPISLRRSGSFGVGIVAGLDTIPISTKYYVSENFSIQATGPFWGIYWAFGLGLSLDFLYEGPPIYTHGSFQIAWQLGLGLDAAWYVYSYKPSDYPINNYYVAGAHPNLGIEFLISSVPMDIVLEYRPTLYASNWSRMIDKSVSENPIHDTLSLFASPYDIALHIRYYF